MVTYSRQRLNTSKGGSYFLFAIIILFICPILALPFTLVGLYYGDRRCGYLLAILGGVWAYLTPPISDLYRWTDIYNLLCQKNSSNLEIIMLANREDYLTQLTTLLLAHYNIPYPFARLIFITVSLSLLINIFYELCPNDISKKSQFYLLLVFLGFFNYYQAVIGVRHGFATCLFFFGYVNLFYKEKFAVAIIFMVLSGLCHSFFWGVSAIVIFIYFVNFRLSNCVIILGIIIMFMIGTALSTYVFSEFFTEQESYVTGAWGVQYANTISLNGIIYIILLRIGLIPLIYFFLKFKFQGKRIRCIISIMIFALATTSGTLTLSGRFLDVVYFLLAANMVAGYHYLSRQIFHNLAIGALVCICSTNFSYRSVYNPRVSQYYRLIYPLPIAMQNQFTQSWVKNNINSEGSVK